MNKITEMRERLASVVKDLPGDTTVTLAPTDYASKDEVMFIVQKTIGDNTPENQVKVDEMFDSFPESFTLDPVFNNTLFVSKCSGHRLYSTYPGAPIQLGCEWTVKVLI